MAKPKKKITYVVTAEYTPEHEEYQVLYLKEDLASMGCKKIKVTKKDA